MKYLVINHWLTLCHTILSFNNFQGGAFRKKNEKDDKTNAGNQHFLLSPKFFSFFPKRNFNFCVTFLLSSATAFNLDQCKILSLGKESTLFPIYTHFNTLKKKSFSKTLWKKVK